MRILEVEHDTLVHYAHEADSAWQLAHLTPLDDAAQRCLSHELRIDPEPAERQEGRDYQGNALTRFVVARPHRLLQVQARSRVALDRACPGAAADALPWEEVARRAAAVRSTTTWPLADALGESPQVPWIDEAAALAKASFTPGRPWGQALLAMARAIHRDFEFDPQATDISTPVREVLRTRRGVCQDFAHLMLSGLRSIGLPARYVSGYLLTQPPPGTPRLVGADASHAWVSAWSPATDWCEVDPTNGKWADDDFVVLARGREFSEVAPLRGVVRGGGAQTLEVRVTVWPEAEGRPRTAP